MQQGKKALGRVCGLQTWPGLLCACTVLLLSACASAPSGKETIDTKLQVSALEAQGPLKLPFGSAYRWLNFPMYRNDTAHAVDLGALRWRSDTLLETASRYPLHDGGSWPKELYSQAWYVYVKRLVDCRTGNDAELSEALLDRDGQVLVERSAKSSPQMSEYRNGEGDRWLASSEIGLACLAAGDPKLLAQRREAASQPAPRISYLPTSALLQDDVTLLRSKLNFRLDMPMLQAVKAQGTGAVLSNIAGQRAQWQRELHGPGAEPKQGVDLWPDDAARKKLEGRINSRTTLLPFKALANGEYERWEDVRRPEPQPALPQVQDQGLDDETQRDAEVVALRHGSCLSEVSLSTHYRWYSWRGGELLAERPASPEESLASMRPADDFCRQLSALAMSLEGEVQQQDASDSDEESFERARANIEQLMKAEQTEAVRAQILLALRKLHDQQALLR